VARDPSIVVRFASNVRDFLKGTDQVEAALEDLADESGDLARDVERDAERMGRAYKDAARKADRAGDDLNNGFGRKARKVGADAGKETGNEFAANLGESLSSGNLEDLATDTAGGLVASFGPAGPVGIALAGLAAVAAIQFGKMKADAAKLKEQVDAVWGALWDEGRAAALAEAKKQVEQFFRDQGDQADDVVRSLNRAGIAYDDLVKAAQGDAAAIAKVETALKRVGSASSDTATALRGGLFGPIVGGNVSAELQNDARNLGKVEKGILALGKAWGDYETSYKRAREYQRRNPLPAARGTNAATADRYGFGQRGQRA
jgi:hypothetical protein